MLVIGGDNPGEVVNKELVLLRPGLRGLAWLYRLAYILFLPLTGLVPGECPIDCSLSAGVCGVVCDEMLDLLNLHFREAGSGNFIGRCLTLHDLITVRL
jgi:hypothetical protein